MASVTAKTQYEASIQKILQIVMEIPDLNDEVWLAISDETSLLWRLREQLTSIQTIRVGVRQNDYYRRWVMNYHRQERTPQDKAQNENISTCEYCRRAMNSGHLEGHQAKTKICIDIQQVRKMERDLLKYPHRAPFYQKYMKVYILVNYYAKRHRENHKPKGMWWVYNLEDVVFREGYPRI